jgi:ribosome modulation factor
MSDTQNPPPKNTIDPGSFATLLAEMVTATTSKDSGVAKLRGIRKRFEKLGCNMRALDLMLKLRNMEDGDREAMLLATLRYCRWSKLKVGETLELLGEKDDRGMPPQKAADGLSDARAYEAGFKAGKAGRNQDGGGFDAGTSGHAKWVEGWNDGQAVLGQQLGDGEEQREGTRRPSRRRGTHAGAAA